jgi:hypothetical protein
MLATMLAFTIILGGCPNGDDSTGGGGDVTKFEGTWKMASSDRYATLNFVGDSYMLFVQTTQGSDGLTTYGSFEFTETAITFKLARTKPVAPPDTDFSPFALNYQISENPSILTLEKQTGRSGNGVRETGGIFTKQQ